MKASVVRDSLDHISEAATQSSAATLLPERSILVVTRSGILAHSLPVAINAVEVTVNQDLKALTPGGGLSPDYLAYALKANERAILHDCVKHGTTVHSVEVPSLLDFEIPIAPTREQHRIVAKIEELFSELDKAVESLTLSRAQLKTYRQALLKAAFEGKLTADWRAANPTHLVSENLPAANPAQDDELFEVPHGWRHVPLDALTEPDRPITYGVIKLGADVPGGVPTLRSSDVRSLRLDLNGVKRIAPEIAQEYGRTFLKGGEVLITVRGTLGGVAVVPPELSDWNISREVAMIAPTKDVTPKYLQYALASPQLSAWFKKRLRGVAYTGINIGTLKEAPIYLCPLGEQHRIVGEVETRLSSVEATDGEIKSGILMAAILRRSILKQAFSGQLVPQDPTDEPAAALLARLREQTPAPRTRRRKTG